MPRYVTILAGPSPGAAQAVLTLADQTLVAEIERLIGRRVVQAGTVPRGRGDLVMLPPRPRPEGRTTG